MLDTKECPNDETDNQKVGVVQTDENLENDNEEDEVAVDETPRKLPVWAVIMAVVAFIIFNAFFLAYAMQVGAGPTN